MGSSCVRMGGVRKACKSFLSKHHFGKKSKEKNLQVDVKSKNNNNRDEDGSVSPRVTSPRLSRHASTGFLPSSLPKTTSQRRSKTPCRIRPSNNLLQSFSRKSVDSSSSFHTAPSLSTRNTSTIIYSNANGLKKPPEMVKRLECTLQELCFGCIKKVNVKRDVLTNEGQIIQEDQVLKIKVQRGWRKGTKVTFEGTGAKTSEACAADITFVVDEKRHPVFKRNGDDLEMGVELSLVEALTGCTLTIPFLDGRESSLMIDQVIAPGHRMTIEGEGMTLPKEKGTRGNLNIRFSVQLPQELTEAQRLECFNILQDSEFQM